MTNTVTRLMNMSREIEEIAALCADPMASEDELNEYRTDLYKARQALQDELVRLFTPLSDEWLNTALLNLYGIELNDGDYADDILLVRAVEQAHGIGGES